jgi:hypothetical protein
MCSVLLINYGILLFLDPTLLNIAAVVVADELQIIIDDAEEHRTVHHDLHPPRASLIDVLIRIHSSQCVTSSFSCIVEVMPKY